MTDEQEEKKSKTYRKVSTNVYLDAKAQLAASDAQMMEALGYGSNAWANWVQEGEMPFVAGVACEALVRRKGIAPERGVTHIIITLEDGRPKQTMTVTKTKTINLDGRDYWLVPVQKLKEG